MSYDTHLEDVKKINEYLESLLIEVMEANTMLVQSNLKLTEFNSELIKMIVAKQVIVK